MKRMSEAVRKTLTVIIDNEMNLDVKNVSRDDASLEGWFEFRRNLPLKNGRVHRVFHEWTDEQREVIAKYRELFEEWFNE